MNTLHDPTLMLAADILDDLERVRNANTNRLRQLTRTGEDADGEERGFGLTEDHPDVARLTAIVDALNKSTNDATKNLEAALRRHPLAPWVKAQRGVGDKTAARLLAAIGDPYLNSATGQPRTVSALWAYCGLHCIPVDQRGDDAHTAAVGGGAVITEAARRKKGVKANWSTNAKTRAWLIIEACMKQLDPACKTDTGIGDHHAGCGCSPYRVIVDQRRQRTTITHPEWTPKHSLNDGMRVASKALLRDLWLEARAWHDTQHMPAAA